MGKLYDTAKFWLDQGIATIPIQYKSKVPKIKWLPYTQQLPSDADISKWFWTDNILGNIGIICGWSDLVILDFDNMGKFSSWFRWVKESGNKTAQQVLNETRMVLSARGVHLYIYCANAQNMKLDDIDILAQRKYALLPPSVHPSGKSYQLFKDAIPIRVQKVEDLFPVDWLKSVQSNSIQSNKIVKTNPRKQQSQIYDPWKIAGNGNDSTYAVELIKRHYHIEDFFPANFLHDSNNGYKMTCCPFHDDHNPSFWIDTEKQLCGCYSGCTQKPLDVIDLYAKLKGISNKEAIKTMLINC